jgi:hypothetical membrane protein
MSSMMQFNPPRAIPALAAPRAVGALREADAQHFAMASVALLALATAIAVATTSDPTWWHLHFSELGTHRDFSGTVFNGGAMTAGTMFVLFALRVRRAFADIRSRLDTVVRARQHAARLLVALIVSFGGHLATVGLVPLDVNTALHERAASGMMLSFLGILVLTIASPWTPRRLRATSLGVAGLLVPAIVTFVLGGMTLAALEVIGFALIFVWIARFGSVLRQAVAAPQDHDVVAHRAGAGAARRRTRSPRVARRAARAGLARSLVVTRAGRVACVASASPAPRGSVPSRRARALPQRHSVLRGPRRPASSSRLDRPRLPASALHGARGHLPRGCRGSAARAGSAPSRR